MAVHKKYPIFIRVIANGSTIVCVNPQQLASFQIIEKAKVRGKDAEGKPTEIIADTIRFYYPNGTALSYSVGVDLDQNDFNYVCATLREYLYLNEQEFKARTEQLNQAQVAEYNRIMAEATAEEQAVTTPKV